VVEPIFVRVRIWGRGDDERDPPRNIVRVHIEDVAIENLDAGPARQTRPGRGQRVIEVSRSSEKLRAHVDDADVLVDRGIPRVALLIRDPHHDAGESNAQRVAHVGVGFQIDGLNQPRESPEPPV
jgi:hypothetical protein